MLQTRTAAVRGSNIMVSPFTISLTYKNGTSKTFMWVNGSLEPFCQSLISMPPTQICFHNRPCSWISLIKYFKSDFTARFLEH